MIGAIGAGVLVVTAMMLFVVLVLGLLLLRSGRGPRNHRPASQYRPTPRPQGYGQGAAGGQVMGSPSATTPFIVPGSTVQPADADVVDLRVSFDGTEQRPYAGMPAGAGPQSANHGQQAQAQAQPLQQSEPLQQPRPHSTATLPPRNFSEHSGRVLLLGTERSAVPTLVRTIVAHLQRRGLYVRQEPAPTSQWFARVYDRRHQPVGTLTARAQAENDSTIVLHLISSMPLGSLADQALGSLGYQIASQYRAGTGLTAFYTSGVLGTVEGHVSQDLVVGRQ